MPAMVCCHAMNNCWLGGARRHVAHISLSFLLFRMSSLVKLARIDHVARQHVNSPQSEPRRCAQARLAPEVLTTSTAVCCMLLCIPVLVAQARLAA